MKKSFFIMLFLLLALGLFACTPKEYNTYKFELPSKSEQIGYSISYEGVFEDGSRVKEGDDIKITIKADEAYTLANFVVKDNGKTIEYKDVSTDGFYAEEKIEFTIKNIREAHKITVEGVKKKQLTVTLKLAKYGESESATEGQLFVEYNDRYVLIKHGDDEYWNKSLAEAFEAINDKNIIYEYGDTFTLFMREIYPNCYSNFHGNMTLDNFYSASPEFNGIFGYKTGEDTYKKLFNVAWPRGFAKENENGSGDYVMEYGQWYKLEFEIKEDTDLYYNTLELEQAKYKIKHIKNEMWDIAEQSYTYSEVRFDEEVSFKVEQIPYSDTVGFIDYPDDIDFSNINVYVNGSKSGVEYDSETGICSFIVHPPSTYNMPNNYDTIFISLDGIKMSEEEELVKISASSSIEGITDITYHRTWVTQGSYIYNISDINVSDSRQIPYYYENGVYYYRKAEEPFIAFYADNNINIEDIIITIDGVELQGINIEDAGDSREGSTRYKLVFGGDYEYPDEMDIVISLR